MFENLGLPRLPQLGLFGVLSNIRQALKIGGCNREQDVFSRDDQTLYGNIVIQNCNCQNEFRNDAWRCASIGAAVTAQAQAYYQQFYNTKINWLINFQLVAENTTHTIFSYTAKVPRAYHDKMRPCIFRAWNNDQVSFGLISYSKE